VTQFTEGEIGIMAANENANEVIGDALRALDRRDAASDESLRAKVKASLANKRPRVPIDEAFARARHAIARRVGVRDRTALK
jgi:antitoxin ParD1/3/4